MGDSSVPEAHVNLLLAVTRKYYQAVCSCGWTSTVVGYEEADLLRAMHAHAFVTFENYK